MGQIIAWPNGAIPESWIESLFEKMLGFYGAKFSDQWRGSDANALKRIWALELGKLSREELKNGVEKIIHHDWPPSLPQFIKLCKPTIDPLVAYYEAVAGVQARAKGEIGHWSHPAIYWAAVSMAFDLSSQSFSQVRGRWEASLAEQMERGEWAEIKAPLIELPAPEISKEKAAEVLAEIGADKVLKPKTDHRRWAKLILEREKRGDRTLTALQVRSAHEALGAPAA